MCQTVYAATEKRDISTPRKLADWLGINPEAIIRLREIRDDPRAAGWEDCCLCPFEVRDTLDREQCWSWQDDTGDIFAMKRTV